MKTQTATARTIAGAGTAFAVRHHRGGVGDLDRLVAVDGVGRDRGDRDARGAFGRGATAFVAFDQKLTCCLVFDHRFLPSEGWRPRSDTAKVMIPPDAVPMFIRAVFHLHAGDAETRRTGCPVGI